MKTLKELLSKSTGKKQPVVFAFGRFNPPTYGHQKLIERVLTITKRVKGKPVLYVSATQDKKRNPLDVKYKIKVIKAIYKSKIQINAATGRERTFMEILTNRFDKKYTDVYMIAGSDRVAEFKKLINKYNGKDYNFDTVNVVSAGERDPDAEGVSGISASKMREFAVKNDYNSFRQGVMKGTKEKDAMKLFKDLKDKMGVREDMLAPIDNEEQKIMRENYHNNDIFNINEWVENIKDKTIGKIIKRGPNYVQYEMEDGGVKKAWLEDLVPCDSVNTDLQVEEVDKKKLVLQKNSDKLIDFKSFDEEINSSTVEEGKYSQYSSLLVQKGKLLAKGLEPNSTRLKIVDKEIEKEKKKLGIKEDLDEGRMKDLHMYIQQKKSAEWIAKKMKLDVKTIKALMNEAEDDNKDPITKAKDKADKDMKIAVLKQKIVDLSKEETELTANDIKEWSLEESTINKFKSRYENNWRVELDNAVTDMLGQVKVEN